MSSVERAMYMSIQSAFAADDELGRNVARKEQQLDKSKYLNRALDTLHRARNDADGHGVKDFTAAERDAVIAQARSAGVELTASDFGKVSETQANFGGHAYLESEDEAETYDDQHNDALDATTKQLERAQQENQDATGMLDFKINLGMNDYSRDMQNAQATQQIRATLNNAMIARA